jgi:hypothetical protein
MYANLDSQPFVLPTLVSVLVFLDGLISVFGNKFMHKNAKRALEVCRQQGLTIGEYNSKFEYLFYLVEEVEATGIEKYVQGLNPCIVHKAICKQWMDCKSLDEKMELALTRPRNLMSWPSSLRINLLCNNPFPLINKFLSLAHPATPMPWR